MRIAIYIIIICLVAFGIKLYSTRETPAPVKPNDPEMAKAFAQARGTVDQFIQQLQHQAPDTRYMVKMKISDGEIAEHIWTDNIIFDGSDFSGTIANEPYQVKGFKFGQRISCPKEQIEDWVVISNTQTNGGFTQELYLKQKENESNQRMDPTVKTPVE